MVAVKIYAEGGGEGEFHDTLFRNAWANFFKEAGLEHRPRVVRGKGRERTFDLFRTAVTNRIDGTLHLLLVDSEEAVDPDHNAWQHLKHCNKWDQPTGAGDDDAFLMVQVMETWFLADRETLRRHFGPQFNENALAPWPDLEAVPKATVLSALDKATAKCTSRYAKGKVSFQLLGKLDPSKVEQRCPHASRLLTRLRTL